MSVTNQQAPIAIILPGFFNHDVRVNPEAFLLFHGEDAPYIFAYCRELPDHLFRGPAAPYLNWKWSHLLQAFKDMKLVDAKTTQSAFANFLVQILPGRKVGNIQQSFYRNCDKMNNGSILKDIKDLFQSVTEKMDKNK